MRMDDKARDQIRRLFAEVTMLLEDAHEVAVAGQSSKITAKSAVRKSEALTVAVRKLERLVAEITQEAARGVKNLPDRH